MQMTWWAISGIQALHVYRTSIVNKSTLGLTLVCSDQIEVFAQGRISQQ